MYKGGKVQNLLQQASAPPAFESLSSPAGTSSPSSGTSTMESSGMFWGLLLLGLLSILTCSQAAQQTTEENVELQNLEPAAADRDLVEALEALLDQMNNHISSTEKRGSIPLCEMGNRCAMKFGPRIGKLCDCGRGAYCNSYLLKCI